MMEDLVVEYELIMSHTDTLFFDCARNVAKAGQVLQAIFPHSYSLHGEEHVVSDMSKFPAIKVTLVFHQFLLFDFSLDLISLLQSHLYLRHSLQRPAGFTTFWVRSIS
jgi:hypothetical protein